jgi:Uma2 family endonuclease
MAESVSRKLTYDDLVDMPDDGLTREILDGVLFVTPSPVPMHQRVSRRLLRQLEDYFESRSLGEVFDAPLDVILGLHDVAEPDILVVTDQALITNRAIEGAPALVVEILSPSTANRDRTLKRARYAAAGVAEYWIVDIERQRIECLTLAGDGYTLSVVAEGREPLVHPRWTGLTIDLAVLWA